MTNFYSATYSVIGLYVELVRKNKKVRRLLVFLFFLLVIAFIILSIFAVDIFATQNLKQIKELMLVGIFITSVLLFLTLVSYTPINFNNSGLSIDLEGLRKEREKIKQRIEKQDDNILDTIQLNLNQLTEYYTINLNQAKSSYRWSITAMILGLLTLLVGIWIIYFTENPNYDIALISGVSGVIIEFTGASNIFIYNKSIKQLNIYFKELIKIQDMMLAIELCEDIEEPNRKIEIKEKIILSLINRSTTKDSKT